MNNFICLQNLNSIIIPATFQFQMARLTVILIGILAINFINGAPNEKIRGLHQSGHHEPTVTDESNSGIDNDEVLDSKRETQRQKRWYNTFPYTPSYVRPRDTELEEDLLYIRLRLQELLDMAKSSPPPPPPPTFYPVYVPIYIPQPQCGCNPTPHEEPTTKAPVITTTPNETVPNLNERLPEMDDERQIWGILVNNSLPEYDDDDGSRPISLTPVITNDDGGIPAPPVEHGSKQADINDVETQTVTTTASPVVFTEPPAPVGRPSACDSAIMSCCFGLDRTSKCVQSRGCRDRSIGANPCNRQTVLSVISRVQNYYG